MVTIAQWIARIIVRGQMRPLNTFWKWREKKTIEFENKELAEFMEDMVEGLVKLDPNAVAVVAINDDRGIAGTQYYGCGVEDKGRMIHHIVEDIVMDIILNNAGTIGRYIVDAEGEDEDDE